MRDFKAVSKAILCYREWIMLRQSLHSSSHCPSKRECFPLHSQSDLTEAKSTILGKATEMPTYQEPLDIEHIIDTAVEGS
jgi:hypothetical protein